MKVLVINPGSTSTKTALYSEKGEIIRFSVDHDTIELSHFPSIYDQLSFRKNSILKAYLNVGSLSFEDLSAVVGRGGLLRPLEGGVYIVNEVMKEDLRSARYGSHASNLGALIADLIARDAGVNAYIVDPVVVDELSPLARYSGLPKIPRKSIFHALNQKATAKKAASKLGKPYNECNLIVAHMGGGTSIGIHEQGRVTDVNNALDGDGPFSVERAGSLPIGDWMRYVLAHRENPHFLQKQLTGKGGLVAYLGCNNARLIDKAIQVYLDNRAERTDMNGMDGKYCLEVMEALCYQISKEICSLSAVVKGNVDAVVLTGGLTHVQRVVEAVKERVNFLAPVLIFPGENELEALAAAVFEVLIGREQVKEYTG